MTPRLVFLPEARAELRAARAWYDAQAQGLGDEFARAIDAVMAILRRNPETFARIDDERRRALVRRFPYQVLYRIEADAIIVLACFHHRRDPAQYESRR